MWHCLHVFPDIGFQRVDMMPIINLILFSDMSWKITLLTSYDVMNDHMNDSVFMFLFLLWYVLDELNEWHENGH